MKKIIDYLLLVVSMISIFIAGLFFYNYKLVSIICLIVGIIIEIFRERFQSNIRGNGVSQITVEEQKPNNPKKGDLWVDTNQKMIK